MQLPNPAALAAAGLEILKNTKIRLWSEEEMNKTQETSGEGNFAELDALPPGGLESAKGCIETVAIGITRDDWNSGEAVDPSFLTAVVLKARHGSGGSVPLDFHKAIGLISETNPNASQAAPTNAVSQGRSNTGIPVGPGPVDF